MDVTHLSSSLLPDGWRASRLREHLREPIRNGFSPVCPEHFTGEWILSLASVGSAGYNPLGAKPAPVGNARVKASRLVAGDLVVSRSNTPDRVGLAGIYSGDPSPASYPDLLMRVRVGLSIDSRLLLEQMLSQKGRNYFSSTARGSSGSMVKIDRAILEAFPIWAPCAGEEQGAIAAVLSDADALIDSLEQLLTKKRQIKQGAMQELLTGKRRLPGFSGEWKPLTMGDLFDFSGGLSASRDQLGNVGPCYLHYGDIHLSNKTYIDLDLEHHEMPRLDVEIGEVTSSALLTSGDVVFVDASEDDDGVSRHVVIHGNEGHTLISGLHTIVAKPKSSELIDSYKRYCFQAPKVRAQFRFYAVGTKVSGVSKGNIAKIALAVPSVHEQAQIAECLCNMDSEIASIETRLTKARALKQAMAQALLTGRIRLVPPDATHGAAHDDDPPQA